MISKGKSKATYYKGTDKWIEPISNMKCVLNISSQKILEANERVRVG